MYGYPAAGAGFANPGTFSNQFYGTGLPNDHDIVRMIHQAMSYDPLVPPNVNVHIHSNAGVVTLTGTAPTKEIKHAIGEDAWWQPGVTDVHNNVQVTHHHAHHGTGHPAQHPAQAGRHG